MKPRFPVGEKKGKGGGRGGGGGGGERGGGAIVRSSHTRTQHFPDEVNVSALPSMYSMFKAGESEMRTCNADVMTVEHLLQHCQLHDALRRDMWPEPILLRDKLYGSLEELKRTAAFVKAIGISV